MPQANDKNDDVPSSDRPKSRFRDINGLKQIVNFWPPDPYDNIVKETIDSPRASELEDSPELNGGMSG